MSNCGAEYDADRDAVHDGAGEPAESSLARRGSIGATFKAVAWSFFGVRRGAAHESDVARLNPVHVVIVALVCAALFVLALLSLVRLVTS